MEMKWYLRAFLNFNDDNGEIIAKEFKYSENEKR